MIDVIIPTKGRYHKIPSICENLENTTDGEYKLTFVIEDDDEDTERVCEQHKNIYHFDIIKGKFGSPAKAVNEGFRKTSEPYFIFGNDDFKFHPHWDTKALSKMTDGISVVAINDGDPRGEPQWGTITLSRRSYVNDYGGTEHKGEVFHEGYSHNFVDTEFWERAASRGVTAIAKDSLIEHLHPAFGKGTGDGGYEKSGNTMNDDMMIYVRRRNEWL